MGGGKHLPFLDSSTKAIDQHLADACADPYHNLPRAAVLAGSSSQTLYAGYAGYKHFPPPPVVLDPSEFGQLEPINERSVFDLWSATKLVAVIAALQLVERGQVGLQDDAGGYVKELKGMRRVVGFWPITGLPIYLDNHKVITVEMLINHTSGFTYAEDSPNPPFLPKAYTREGTKEDLTRMSLRHNPGEHWSYGTSNDWLSRVVEEVSGLNFEDYLQKHVFKPLGIKDMSYLPNPDMMTPGLALEDPNTYAFKPYPCFSPTAHFGGAGLNGSASSYLLIVRSLLGGGILPDSERILRPETVDMMFENHLKLETMKWELKGQTNGASDPFTFHQTPEERDERVSWGYGGMIIEKELKSGRAKGSLTWSGLMNTWWCIDRTNDVAILVWTNTFPTASKQIFDLWEKVELEIYKGIGVKPS